MAISLPPCCPARSGEGCDSAPASCWDLAAARGVYVQYSPAPLGIRQPASPTQGIAAAATAHLSPAAAAAGLSPTAAAARRHLTQQPTTARRGLLLPSAHGRSL